MRHLSIVGLGLTMCLAVAGCGDETSAPPAGCTAQTCPNGCCDSSGICRTWSATSCGLSGTPGETCIICDVGKTCTAQGVCSSGGGGACNATNCAAGCCGFDDKCKLGRSATECGVGGVSCQVCGAGEQCENQSCTKVSCDATTCPTGCCSATGDCLPGTTEGACGSGGQACKTCDGQTCENGQCKAIAKPCDATICPNGCCDSDGTCVTSPTDQKCGGGGEACEACGTGQTCDGGKCTCTSSSCPGCCDGDSCKAGNIPSACGKDGAACQTCQAPNTCVGSACAAGCSPSSCPGCCDGNQCNFGGATDSSACGVGGAACQKCNPGDTCASGTCNNPQSCDPSTCASGCCAGGQCQSGTSSQACGTSGKNCQACAAFQFCSAAQTCDVKPTSTWQVTIQRIELDTTAAKWLDTTSDPDPYIILTTGTQTKQSSVKKNTFTPLYNEALFTATASDLTTVVKYKIYDQDLDWDDLVIECDTKFTSAQLSAGQATLTSCPSDPQNKKVNKVVFTFTLITP